MWEDLPESQKKEYKELILAFASLTAMFSQKTRSDDENYLSPIINSKFQETVFQKAFSAFAEDISNTSYDASIIKKNDNGTVNKYLVGIKTFGLASGAQKIAQFKKNHEEWAETINKIKKNSEGLETKEEINKANQKEYQYLAKAISVLRNQRILSSEAQLYGFSIVSDNKNVSNEIVESVYHVLMPSKKGDPPTISVGEIDYRIIDINNLKILGCTKTDRPTNFDFTDGYHEYRYTSADSQLLMLFDNENIVKETWNVKYANDAYEIFKSIAKQVFSDKKLIESHCWKLYEEDCDVPLFSGFNSFYGVGSKLGQSFSSRIHSILQKFKSIIENEDYIFIKNSLSQYINFRATTKEKRLKKSQMRQDFFDYVLKLNIEEFSIELKNVLYRPENELYIPIKNSVKFHQNFPDFFVKGFGNLIKINNKWKSSLLKEQRKFTLVFEPSGDCIEAFITQDGEKGIESWKKQSVLGKWILRHVFQLESYEPLRVGKLNELEINGIRLSKYENDDRIHLEFIWIDDNNLPKDYWN